MLGWANRFNICCFLDNHQYKNNYHNVECLLGAGATDILELHPGIALSSLKDFQALHKDWLFGHLGFDLKNEIEAVHSSNPDHIKFPDLFFFVPEIVLHLTQNELHIGMKGNDHSKVYSHILGQVLTVEKRLPLTVSSRFSREEYIDAVNKLRAHILAGDCYEINFCQEFYAENAVVDPVSIYNSLSNSSPNPFSAYYKLNDKYCLCASPERYLQKSGRTLLSQPIKGTWQRNENDTLDEMNKNLLYQSKKERAENVMIVDLVRNDLSRVCEEGTVKVDELFGIYSFPNVHQMISTVTGTLMNGVSFADAIKASFPMGSMTGAPKKKVLEIIDRYEKTKRGLFSGSIGYIKPDTDFDFNVVIRSILYNESEGYLSYQTGSAITFESDAEMEYNECLLKGMAIKKVLAS